VTAVSVNERVGRNYWFSNSSFGRWSSTTEANAGVVNTIALLA